VFRSAGARPCASPATCIWATSQIDGRPVLFDCLEFSADLRWTDVFSDVAFMAMDLHSHDLPALAHRFVNAYVERSDDAQGLQVLRYYRVHRALVLAKVAALRAAQLGAAAAQAERQSMHHYLQVALTPPPAAAGAMLTHGFGQRQALAAGLFEACGRSAFAPMSSATAVRADRCSATPGQRRGCIEPGQPGDAAAPARMGRAGAAKRLQRDPRRHISGTRGKTSVRWPPPGPARDPAFRGPDTLRNVCASAQTATMPRMPMGCWMRAVPGPALQDDERQVVVVDAEQPLERRQRAWACSAAGPEAPRRALALRAGGGHRTCGRAPS
jgi:hypothetical protein